MPTLLWTRKNITDVMMGWQRNMKRLMTVWRNLKNSAKVDMIISEFDEELWHAVIDKVTVYSEEDVKFTFRDGTVVKV